MSNLNSSCPTLQTLKSIENYFVQVEKVLEISQKWSNAPEMAASEFLP